DQVVFVAAPVWVALATHRVTVLVVVALDRVSSLVEALFESRSLFGGRTVLSGQLADRFAHLLDVLQLGELAVSGLRHAQRGVEAEPGAGDKRAENRDHQRQPEQQLVAQTPRTSHAPTSMSLGRMPAAILAGARPVPQRSGTLPEAFLQMESNFFR